MNGSEEKSVRSTGKRWLRWIVVVIAFFGLCFLMAPMGNAVPFLFIGHLGIGWWWHAASVLPPLLPQWSSLLLPLACLGIAIPIGHRFMLWLMASRERAANWRLPQTLSVMALLLLTSAAAIAMSGITHQLAWLLRTQSIESTGSGGSFSKAWGATKDWAKAIRDFEMAEGRYPESLAEVAATFPESRLQPRVAPAASRLPEPFIYLKPEPGESEIDQVLIVSPARSNGLIVVGFASGRVSMHPASKLQDLIEGKEEP